MRKKIKNIITTLIAYAAASVARSRPIVFDVAADIICSKIFVFLLLLQQLSIISHSITISLSILMVVVTVVADATKIKTPFKSFDGDVGRSAYATYLNQHHQ